MAKEKQQAGVAEWSLCPICLVQPFLKGPAWGGPSREASREVCGVAWRQGFVDCISVIAVQAVELQSNSIQGAKKGMLARDLTTYEDLELHGKTHAAVLVPGDMQGSFGVCGYVQVLPILGQSQVMHWLQLDMLNYDWECTIKDEGMQDIIDGLAGSPHGTNAPCIKKTSGVWVSSIAHRSEEAALAGLDSHQSFTYIQTHRGSTRQVLMPTLDIKRHGKFGPGSAEHWVSHSSAALLRARQVLTHLVEHECRPPREANYILPKHQWLPTAELDYCRKIAMPWSGACLLVHEEQPDNLNLEWAAQAVCLET
ncbi:hypothetical protein IE81DRAFT_354514 [Ceraceosorus guamensis]|uniref:Uncharacterized protein n=1 Tax=Ceraceosorus guamensis TaxID=1522189 RepID=A0A316W1A9_9BASI|nr:hypothetical protein IE81DRAFT_354514 [Ceraceosorus guamensis]PWN43636.1 hypothetical protein IE81DRAFT_354514 [Ceraceosorus guamensis]